MQPGRIMVLSAFVGGPLGHALALAPAPGVEALAESGIVQGEDGGWGPYVTSPSEPFDTAVALLALARFKNQEESLLRRGRRFLMASQKADGSWTETTRPAGAESYAQRISTAAWTTLALLDTSPENVRKK